MRKVIYTTGLIAAMTAFSSCKKYLDIVPVGRVVPTTVDDFRKELDAAYLITTLDKGLASYRGDEIKMNESRSGDVNQLKPNYFWNENSGTVTSTYNWRANYEQIFYANHIIDAVGGASEGSQEQKNQLAGEAFFIRAYAHFNLVNLYGKPYNEATAAIDKAVPVITKVDLEKAGPRNTVKETFDQIIADIEAGQALINVEQFETITSFRFTKLAGQAFAARVYLYTHQWEKSLANAKAVLEKKSTLIDFNKSTSLPTMYNSPESIQAFEQAYSTTAFQGALVSDQLYAMYNPTGDLRLKIFYGKDSKQNNIILKTSGNNNFRQSFRVAEMYLIAAEAAAHLNQEDQARNYLNELKKNRLTPVFYQAEVIRLSTLSGNDLQKEIQDERFRELAFEGHRWFDLRRTTQPQIVHSIKGQTGTLQAGDPRYTIRIPSDAIANNPALAD
ncbi:RagB/SusD family nutrient uptake outer membrane protein [Chitinophaga qingshengii]|uniref:RagB/SusD family nutrient uptake outer membrane protein n=1 Tax=Chitinophaga qingshengii TaxID=1569794 RepID=A0ABR7TWK6_9BACT|nr:RagB/SusD family nutrient uptake outer membrane protein [Chitinophaga qingshengii]MBC9934864.1 RagB/SusD family nutrient uptake outer membrane protein [Chitinophaga qingshengii]